jgi:hypothetical protein
MSGETPSREEFKALCETYLTGSKRLDTKARSRFPGGSQHKNGRWRVKIYIFGHDAHIGVFESLGGGLIAYGIARKLRDECLHVMEPGHRALWIRASRRLATRPDLLRVKEGA